MTLTPRQRAMREAAELELDATMDMLREALVHAIEQRIELELENEQAARDILELRNERDQAVQLAQKTQTMPDNVEPPTEEVPVGNKKPTLEECLGGLETSTTLSWARQENTGERDESGLEIPKRISVGFHFSEKNYGFGDISIVWEAGQIFIDSEYMPAAKVKEILGRVIDHAIFDWDKDPERHRRYSQVMRRTCGQHCKLGCDYCPRPEAGIDFAADLAKNLENPEFRRHFEHRQAHHKKQEAKCEGVGFKVGDRVKKFKGEYHISGEVRAVLTTRAGKTRYVVEHDPGLLHIYSGEVLRAKDAREYCPECMRLDEAHSMYCPSRTRKP